MKRPNNRVPLLGVIFGWVLFGLVALLIVLNQFAFWQGMGIGALAKKSGTKDGVFFSTVTASLTVVGGIGAVAYLVIKYRERMDAERDLQFKEVREAETKLKDAVEQLGSESPQVRLAGVYSLADVADTYLGGYKQLVVDILCGYLRTDRSNQLVDGRFKDAAVESAILKVILNHITRGRSNDDGTINTSLPEESWSQCDFDFRNVFFREPVSFKFAFLEKRLVFSGVIFSSEVDFMGALFPSGVSFDNVLALESINFESVRCEDFMIQRSLIYKDFIVENSQVKDTLSIIESVLWGQIFISVNPITVSNAIVISKVDIRDKDSFRKAFRGNLLRWRQQFEVEEKVCLVEDTSDFDLVF